ncbi:hypothetical protein As57867_022499, partial [Aphanomyces stellatus]
MAVTSEAPTKSLGILVAPNLSPMARFNYVFERFVSRLSLWLYKARTYAGKVAILHSICLPVLWYQLPFVPAGKNLAKLIDRVMLQFMHGEEINRHRPQLDCDSSRTPLCLRTRTTVVWIYTTRSISLTKPQSKSKMAAWISPGYALLERAFHPWGSAQDVLFASGNSTFMRQLMRNPNATPMWSAMLSSWFEVRWTPFGLPSNAASLDIPLWHNAFSPGLENLYDQCSASTRPQALTLALLKINKLPHLLTSCQRVLASLDLVRAHQRGLCTPKPRTANEAMDFDSGDQVVSIVSHRPCRRSPSVQAPNHQRGVAVCPVDDPSRSRADFVDDSVVHIGKDQDTSIDRPAPHTHQAPQPVRRLLLLQSQTRQAILRLQAAGTHPTS